MRNRCTICRQLCRGLAQKLRIDIREHHRLLFGEAGRNAEAYSAGRPGYDRDRAFISRIAHGSAFRF
jgi:hypothetical protein